MLQKKGTQEEAEHFSSFSFRGLNLYGHDLKHDFVNIATTQDFTLAY